MNSSPNRPVAIWLLACSFMVLCILIVGGVTRLTHSGLSIVEWQPIIGTLPPLNADEWNIVFDKYKLTPEYVKVNHQMTLDEFKGIFWWEYIHRVIGRLIGVVFAVPFAYFLIKGKLDRSLAPKLVGIFVLGGLQGAMGWYMVKSGLVDDPRVSQYRLTAHLSLAFMIFASMFWVALGQLRARDSTTRDPGMASLQRWGLWLLLGLAYMIVTGGFVAGIRAGKAYNTFPLMNGSFIPPEIFMLEPLYLNFFNNMATVQFDHRIGAWLLAIVVPWFWLKLKASQASVACKRVANLLLVALFVQIALGIATLLMAVPVALGAAHQGFAMVLFGFLLWVNHELRVNR